MDVLRMIFGNVFSYLVLGALIAGWWMAADGDVTRMADQAAGLLRFLGGLVQPLIEAVVDNTNDA